MLFLMIYKYCILGHSFSWHITGSFHGKTIYLKKNQNSKKLKVGIVEKKLSLTKKEIQLKHWYSV